MQIHKASDYLYMHVQTILLATLANLVFQINVANGKNWIVIDFDNNEQINRAGGYIYMHMQAISLATLANLIFQINVANGKNWILIIMSRQIKPVIINIYICKLYH